MAALDPQKDLDAFLTSIESKLRGPFSSLDWLKTVTTPALRGSLSERDYLDRVSQVISRADKITQCRILIGLLGIDPSDDETAEVVDRIVRQTQEAPLHEEWVRVISSLVQGILQQTEDGRPNLGEEAKSLLEKTCSEIIQRIIKLQNKTEGVDEDMPSRLATADADPTFAPFRYALLKPSILEKVIKETQSHAHFTINEGAALLSMDADMELQKANEEKEHVVSSSVVGIRPNTTAAQPVTKPEPIMPGMRSKTGTNNAASAATKSQSSLFMPRKPMIGRPVDAAKTSLHTRKAGAAQALLLKGRRNKLKNISAPATVTAGGVRGRFSNIKSRMKMIDVAEVQDLSKQEKEREDASNPKTKKVSGLKRKAESAPVDKVSKPKMEMKQETPNEPTKPPDAAAGAGALAAAALAAYQTQTTASSLEQPAPLDQSAAAPTQTSAKQQDWRQMLQTKSNRLSADDRFRIQQFFQDKINPTPGEKLYKMKLHEERSTDPKSGAQLKETYYLELDYTTFTSKQSKKTKRY